MRNPTENLFNFFKALTPFFMILAGGFGVLYTLAVPQGNSLILVMSLVSLLIGVSFYTFIEITQSDVFKKRFGIADKKKSKGKHKKAGKRCPQCGKVIYHRRTACQHCGHKFPSHKDGEDEEGSEADELIETSDDGK